MADEGVDEFITTESGLRYKVTKEGTGAIPVPGQTVKAHYTGTSTRCRVTVWILKLLMAQEREIQG